MRPVSGLNQDPKTLLVGGAIATGKSPSSNVSTSTTPMPSDTSKTASPVNGVVTIAFHAFTTIICVPVRLSISGGVGSTACPAITSAAVIVTLEDPSSTSSSTGDTTPEMAICVRSIQIGLAGLERSHPQK